MYRPSVAETTVALLQHGECLKSYILKTLDIVSNNKATARGFVQLSLLRVGQLLLGLLSTYFIAHSLTVAQYGEYQLILSVIAFLTVFSLTEFPNTLIQSIARGFHGSFRKITPYPFFASLLGSLVLTGFAVWHGFKDGHETLMVCFIVAAVFFPCMHGLTIWRGYLIGEQKFSLFSKVETIGLLVTQGGMITLALLFQGQYTELLIWFCAVSAIINIVMTMYVHRQVPKETVAEEKVIESGVKTSLYNVIFIMSNYTDRLLLFYFLSPVALALFVAADRIPDLLRSPLQDMATALAPKFAKTEYYSERLDCYFKVFCLAFGALLLFLAFTIIPYLLTTIYGDSYAEAVPYTQALILAGAIGNLSSLQLRYIRSKLETKHFRNIIYVTSFMRLLISAALIPTLGIKGAVISVLLYRIVLSVTTNHIIHKHYKAEAV